MKNIAGKESKKISKRGGARPNSGGVRPNSGRPLGTPNKRTAELVAECESGGIMPLEFLLKIMRDRTKLEPLRIDAAKAAAPYLHAKLSSIEVNGNITAHEATIDELG